MALESRLSLSVTADQTSALDLTTVTAPVSWARQFVLASGTGAGQADKIFSDQRTLAASGTENLDLAGALTDVYGATITFARIKAILIGAASGNTNNVLVGGHATAAFVNWVGDATDRVAVRPGGLFALIATDATAYAAVATSADMLTVTNSGAGTGVTYDVILIGASV